MKAILAAALILAALPAWAQSRSESSDRYRRDQPSATEERPGEQAQTPGEPRQPGQIESLRRDHMSSPNVQGERVPEDPSTGTPEPRRQRQPERTEGGIRP